MTEPVKRLRLAHLVVTPVLVWDDGDEITPGPQLNATVVPLSRVLDMAARLPKEVEALAAQLADAEPDEPTT